MALPTRARTPIMTPVHIRPVVSVRWPGALRWALAFSFIVLLTCMVVRPVGDLERWWLLWLGHTTISTGIPHHLLDSTVPTRTFVPQQWLYAVILTWLTDHHANSVLVVGTVLANLATIAIGASFLRARFSTPIIVAWIMLATYVLSIKIEMRAEPIALFLCALELLALRTEGRARWWALPVLLLWSNLHGSFVLGVALLWLFLLTEPSAEMGFLALAASLLTIIEPGGATDWAQALWMTGPRSWLYDTIAEWHPTWAVRPDLYLVWCASLYPVIRARGWTDRRGAIIYVAAFLLATSAIRQIGFAFVLLLPLALATLRPIPDENAPRVQRIVPRVSAALGIYIVWFTIVTTAIDVRAGLARDPQFGVFMPRALVTLMMPLDLRGKRVYCIPFNLCNIALGRGAITTLDGRIDAFPGDLVRNEDLVALHPALVPVAIARSQADVAIVLGIDLPAVPGYGQRTAGVYTRFTLSSRHRHRGRPIVGAGAHGGAAPAPTTDRYRPLATVLAHTHAPPLEIVSSHE